MEEAIIYAQSLKPTAGKINSRVLTQEVRRNLSAGFEKEIVFPVLSDLEAESIPGLESYMRLKILQLPGYSVDKATGSGPERNRGLESGVGKLKASSNLIFG